MDDVTKKALERISEEKRTRPATKSETVEIVATSAEESTRLTLNAIKEAANVFEKLVEKVEKLANKEIIVNPPDVKVESKEVKVEIPDEVKVSNLKDLKLPQPKVEVTTEKYEIVNENVDLEPLTKAIKEQKLPIGEGEKANKNADPTRYTVMRLTNGRQFVEPVAGGGSSSSVGDKVWPVIDITYDGNGNPTSIVKQADGVRSTQNIAYDGNNNPIRFTLNYDNI